MSTFIINGGRKLTGSVKISGAKNAATPILAATLLTRQVCTIKRVPRIKDVEKMLAILASLGASVKWTGPDTVRVDTSKTSTKSLNTGLVKSMRSSILLLGPMLALFKQVSTTEPGGDIIGRRPIDTHLDAFAQLGVTTSLRGERFILRGEKLKSAMVTLKEFSVTASENAIMAAVLLSGITTIKMAANEPHVQDLISFLNKAGAKISWLDSHTIKIKGVKKLHGTTHTVIPDQIEIGTLAVAAGLTKGKIRMKPVVPEHLESIVLKLKQIGFKINLGKDYMVVDGSGPLKAFKFQSLPYPGLPTDLQAPFTVLATACKGESLIHDPMYEGRLGHVSQLVKMGAQATICDPHRVIVNGPKRLNGREFPSLDIRAGATMVLAGLAARGTTTIHQAEIVERGYENFEGRLRKLGAKIKKVDD